MKKLFLMLGLMIVTISGCGNVKSINDIAFDVEFTQLNKDDDTALFTISGLPNDEEFKQIPQVIVDSLNAQNLKPNEQIRVTIKSVNLNGKELDFGSCVYQNGELIENNIKNASEDEFLSYLE